ncbi:hypothetical protein [Halorussus litoreus]|uniref:hypothetical protein n=1 Tax=Halorussus litoreus TaxID=1710536 RepID=UPI000E2411D6|nr:hypothetical protein [Halorussus litoreus]
MSDERPGELGINVDLDDILPANSHITMEEFLETAEEVDSLFELTRETRLSREKCRRILKYFERDDEVKQGFGFLRDSESDDEDDDLR